MKRLILLIILVTACTVGFAQKSTKKKKLNKAESSQLTREQRLAHEEDRKTKNGKKKNLTMEQKVNIAKKQDRKARKNKGPKKAKSRKSNGKRY